MLGFWEKVGKGRRGWWGAGRKSGGGGVKNVWPQRKESEWCCAFSTGLWAGWLAGLKVQEVWASSGFLPKWFFFSISALFAPHSNPSPIGLNVRRFNLCLAESFGTAPSGAALDTVTASQLCKYIHEIRIALWSSPFFVLRKMEPVTVFRALVTALE